MPKQNTKASTKKSGKQSTAKKQIQKTKPAKSSQFTKTITLHRNQKDVFTMNDKWAKLGFASRAIHAGSEPDPVHGGVNPSIELSSTYAQPYPGSLASCYDYSRCGNPTVMALQRNLASMEGAKYALAMANGMSATITALSLLKQGDHLLVIDDVYGGTQRYMNKVWGPNCNIDFDMIDMRDLKKVRAQFKPNTKMVLAESPTNPTMKCTDLKELAKLCKEKKALLVIDNTFMSPVLQNPIALGADVVMHSITKYIGGHSDVVAGCLCFNDGDLYDKLFFNMKSMGTSIAPFDAYLALRGSKTMKLRVEQASKSALEIAQMLEKHPKVVRVLFPGLPSHPDHKIALKNRSNNKINGGSGMLSFYIKGDIKKTNKFLSSLTVCTLAESLGGVETLIESPALMTHGSVPPEKRKLLGIDDNFVRLSVGVEEVEDLIADLKQALAKI